MKKLIFLSSILMLCAFSALWGIDFSIGEKTEIVFAADLSGNARENYGLYNIVPIINVSDELIKGSNGDNLLSLEFMAQVRIHAMTLPSGVALTPDSFYLKAWIGSGISFSIGYYVERNITAEFFSQTSFFCSSDPLSFFEQGLKSVYNTREMMGKLAFSKGLFRGSVIVAPFTPLPMLPALDSVWFPGAGAPESIYVGGQTYTVTSLGYDTTLDLNPFSFDPAYQASSGVSMDNLDIDLTYFYGIERKAAFSVNIPSMPTPSTFDIVLSPHQSKVHAVGLSLTYIIDSVRLWTDTSYTFGASFSSGNIEFAGVFLDGEDFTVTGIPSIINADRLGITAGLSWHGYLRQTRLDVMAEVVWTHFFLEQEVTLSENLAKAIVVHVASRDSSDRFSLACTGLLSLEDGSYLINPSVAFGFGDGNSIDLGFPIFRGTSDSEFGIYSDKRFLFLSLTHRY